MHPQLREIESEFQAAWARLQRLALQVPAERWPVRRDPGRWSVAECVAHLNLTGVAYVPILADAIARARARAAGESAPTSHRRDLLGWLLWRAMGPPVRLRTRTTAAFVPDGILGVEQLLAEFGRLQEMMVERLGQADGLRIGEVRVASPFNPRLRYNLFACFGILARHQHRHLWQAEQVWKEGK